MHRRRATIAASITLFTGISLDLHTFFVIFSYCIAGRVEANKSLPTIKLACYTCANLLRHKYTQTQRKPSASMWNIFINNIKLYQMAVINQSNVRLPLRIYAYIHICREIYVYVHVRHIFQTYQVQFSAHPWLSFSEFPGGFNGTCSVALLFMATHQAFCVITK